VVNVDETSWRENRRKVWLWATVTKLATVFTIATHRSREVASALLGSRDKHRTLVEESLRRKIAHLRESVISTLETILARRGGEMTDGGAKVDTGDADSLLESADEAIRYA
jgi:hypothetical protein